MSNSFRPPLHFTVSQIRVAACCPRILFFDMMDDRRARRAYPRVTRIWEDGDGEAPAGGALFHAAIEKFNRCAGENDLVAKAFNETKDRDSLFRSLMTILKRDCINQRQLNAKSIEVITNFDQCVQSYMGEMADIVHYARTIGKSSKEIIEQLFTKLPKRLDVTFHLSPDLPPVHVTGRVDYVFFDWRINHYRIIDYKLAPCTNPNKDQFQVATYALMYYHQHQYECHADVLYLHPHRLLVEQSWSKIQELRPRIYQLLASMAAWVDPDESHRLKPRGEEQYCSACRWRKVCVDRLGPKSEGAFLSLESNQKIIQPVVEAHIPNEDPAEEEELVDETDPVAEDTAAADLRVGVYSTESKIAAMPVRNLATHTAVVGAAGSGKTWMAKVIAEEAIRQQVPVLAIDPQGDLVQFLRPRPRHEIPPEWQKAYDEFHERVEVRIYTPGTSHAERLSLSPLRMPTDTDLSHLSPERRSEELDSMLSGCAGNLVSLASIGGEVDSQRTLVFKILAWLRAQSDPSMGLSDVIAALEAPDSCGIDADRILKKTEREKLARKLIAFLEGPASNLFQQGTPLDLDQMVSTKSPQKTPLNIIYLNAMAGDQEKQFFTAMLAEEIYRWMLTADKSAGRPSLLFYLDEARDFLPAGTKKTPAKPSLLRLFTQGRKYGVGCLLCTQSPRSVDYNAFGNCSTKIIGRLEASQDVDRVQEWFTLGGAPPAWVSARKGAKPGSFVGRWPDAPPSVDGQAFSSRTLFSSHSGAWSPDQLEEEWRNRK